MPSATVNTVPDEKLTIIQPTQLHTHTLILLHDRSFTASSFASSHRNLAQIFPSTKFVFPSAGLRYHSRSKTSQSQWFDIWDVRSPSEKSDLQIEGLRESIAFILSVVREEAALVGPEKVVLGGMGQGCATAVHALFYGGVKLGGFVGLSGWLPFQEDIELRARYAASRAVLLHQIRQIFYPAPSSSISFKTSSKSVKPITPLTDDTYPTLALAFQTPVFVSHSRGDEVVPFRNGDQLCWGLEEVLGFKDVTFREYEGKDGFGGLGKEDLVEFLGNIGI